MAKKKKNGFDTTMLQKYADRLEAAGGSAALQKAVIAGMTVSKQEVNKLATAALQTSNLPAGGKYSSGATLESLDRDMAVKWTGNLAALPLGFDMSKSGITSILLMYGTPKMQPAPGLYEALYGPAARRAIRKEQETAILKVLERLGG